MSRPIKFRAWDSKESEWLFGKTGFSMFGEMVIMGEWGNAAWRSISDDEPSRYVLLQYTGLKDKNGVEIYEGDIVIREKANSLAQPRAFSVKWQQTGSRTGFGIFAHDGKVCVSLEVVGNIYEHPHLLDKS